MEVSTKAKMISDSSNKNAVRLSSERINDKGKVQLGGFGPVFRAPSVADKGKVQLGGFGPIFRSN